jgi:putative spermidine/putrescine transport system substrate-binding protein
LKWIVYSLHDLVKLCDVFPDGTSAQENQAIISNKVSKRAPDVLDVGLSFADIGRKQKLYLPYKNANWATIPANLKDPNGYWVGDYWGVISFGTNVDVAKTAPQDWADLKNPAYKNMVALGGDPRQAGEAFAAVFAASLANGGSLDDITPGIQFFADLKTAGNFITTQATSATKASGQTPIVAGWDYLQLADRDLDKGKVNVQAKHALRPIPQSQIDGVVSGPKYPQNPEKDEPPARVRSEPEVGAAPTRVSAAHRL